MKTSTATPAAACNFAIFRNPEMDNMENAMTPAQIAYSIVCEITELDAEDYAEIAADDGTDIPHSCYREIVLYVDGKWKGALECDTRVDRNLTEVARAYLQSKRVELGR